MDASPRPGLPARPDPAPVDHVECRDALLDLSDAAHPREADWPAAEFIVGNPPFLGGRRIRGGLDDAYAEALFRVFEARLPSGSDLCCYWHEKARAAIRAGRTLRAGLLATQGIRGGSNRRVLERITQSGGIFFARADDPWVLSGAAVHIGFIGQDDGSETERTLDGRLVRSINTNLTTGVDLTRARRLYENAGVSWEGDIKGGPFEIPDAVARPLLRAPNPDGRDNADVVKPWVNGLDITRRPRQMWIIDYGIAATSHDAALYEQPFEYVRRMVRPLRQASRSRVQAWWLHKRPRSEMWAALSQVGRYIGSPKVTKHRLFVWLPRSTVPDQQLIVFARDDDYTFGVLHSHVHEAWARGTGTQLREVESGFRYTPTTCFETFPFPRPTDSQRKAIAAAARELVRLRDGWLNPPGLVPEELAKRTLTNLYNARPTWLANAHADLDRAVLAAYGWPADLPPEEVLARLLELNLSREPV